MIMVQPWERQPGEPARAYAAFCKYRDLPPHERSLRRAAEEIAKTSSKPRRVSSIQRQLSVWSSQWNWVERAAAWDEEQDRIARLAQLEAIKEMRERHAREAMMLQKKAIERLNSMDPRELSAADVLRFLVEAAKLERLARGEPDTIQEHKGTVNVNAEHRSGLIQQILGDPETRELARELFRRAIAANLGGGREK